VLVGDYVRWLSDDGSLQDVATLPRGSCSVDAAYLEDEGVVLVAIAEDEATNGHEPNGHFGGYGGGSYGGGNGGLCGLAAPLLSSSAESGIRVYSALAHRQMGRSLFQFGSAGNKAGNKDGNKARGGWVRLGSVGPGACRVSLSPDGQRAGWCEADTSCCLHTSCCLALRQAHSHSHHVPPSRSPSALPPMALHPARSPNGANEGRGGAKGGCVGGASAKGGVANAPTHSACLEMSSVWSERSEQGEVRLLRGDFSVAELSTNGAPLTPRAITHGAMHCRTISIAPDGTGVVYLATHRLSGGSGGSYGGGGGGGLAAGAAVPPAAGDPNALNLWWQVWDGGLPPVLLCDAAQAGRILSFGWAPRVEDEEHAFENEQGEEENEILPGLRLWVTALRHGCQPHSSLIDLQGAILGAFELPIARNAVGASDDPLTPL